MTYREVARKLTSLGCREIPRRGGGSHRKWLNLVNNRSTVVPDWAAAISSWERCAARCANWDSSGTSSRRAKSAAQANIVR